MPDQKTGFLVGSSVLVMIGLALLALAPSKSPAQATAEAAR